jgi:NadR type nicotinamide-nucleotide adenylyltransferase
MPPDPPTRTLVIDKFLPLHAGHQHVIATAVDAGGTTDVVVCDRPGERPDATRRAGWIRTLFPDVTIHVIDDICAWHGDDDCPPACSPAWAAHLAAHGLGPWTHVRGSESYVRPFADALDAQPVLVDADRHRHPVSGRAIRDDLGRHWDGLDPVVRAGLVRRVVVVGAESTGTTTLARDLAGHLGVPWVPEYGRTYSEERAAAAGSIFDVEWRTADFDHIAGAQEQLEDATIERWIQDAEASRPRRPWDPVLICDTDVLATAVWHRRYVGEPAPHLEDRARDRPPLLYVLTSPDGVPFEQDGLRDGEHVRHDMTGWFREALAAQGTPWIEVVSSRSQRIDTVTTWLDAYAGPAVHTSPPVSGCDGASAGG